MNLVNQVNLRQSEDARTRWCKKIEQSSAKAPWYPEYQRRGPLVCELTGPKRICDIVRPYIS